MRTQTLMNLYRGLSGDKCESCGQGLAILVVPQAIGEDLVDPDDQVEDGSDFLVCARCVPRPMLMAALGGATR